jgi:hypothetical protein
LRYGGLLVRRPLGALVRNDAVAAHQVPVSPSRTGRASPRSWHRRTRHPERSSMPISIPLLHCRGAGHQFDTSSACSIAARRPAEPGGSGQSSGERQRCEDRRTERIGSGPELRRPTLGRVREGSKSYALMTAIRDAGRVYPCRWPQDQRSH